MAADASDSLKDCERWRAKALQDPTVQFMFAALSKSGCPVPLKAVACVTCNMSMFGGFHPEDGIVLCAENAFSYEQVRETIVHELVHAFDACRAFMDWTNCVMHACSEIRASSLSGECRFLNEIDRGHFAVRAQFNECVRRRALLSVAKNSNCAGEKGVKAVAEAWDVCSKDTKPFDFAP